MANILKNTSVLKSIAKLYLKEELADVKFAFKQNGTTQTVSAHKLILASASPVFNTMFFGSLPENDVVDIVDASLGEFEEFLQFFYLSEVRLTMENTEGVARLADKYDMLDCMNTCATFLESQLTNRNMFWGYQLAISLNNQKLRKFCEDKIVYLAFELFKSQAFLHCDRKVLKNILEMDELACSEFDIFTACMEWAKISCRQNKLSEDSGNLKKQLSDCFYLIRFGQLRSEEIGELMTNKVYAGMFSRDELLEVLCATTAKDFKLRKFKQKSRSNPSFERNSNPILICSLIGANDCSTVVIGSKNYVTFSTNVPVLLGKFQCVSIIESNYGRPAHLTFNINITEKDLHTGKDNVLFTGTVDYGEQERTPTVNLTRAIVVRPKKQYTICFECTTNIDNGWYACRTGPLPSCIELDQGITVTIHQNQQNNESIRVGTGPVYTGRNNVKYNARFITEFQFKCF